MVIIQSVADDELVTNLHANVVDRVGVLEVVWLEEQRGDAYIGSPQIPEFLCRLKQGVASVDDVFHDDHMATVQRAVQANEFADDVGSLGACV